MGAVVVAVVLVGDVAAAIGFSSFAVLTYYAIANASAWTLPAGHSRGSRAIPLLGFAGCAALAFTLPIGTVLAGIGVLATGAAVWWARGRRSHRR